MFLSLKRIYLSLSSTFILVFLSLGLVFVTWLAPFQGPDENAHWQTSVNRASNFWIGTPSHCGPSQSLADFFQAGRIATKYPESMQSKIFRSLDAIPPTCSKYDIIYGTPFTYLGTLISWPFFKNKDDPLKAVMFYYVSRYLGGLIMGLLLLRLLYKLKQAPIFPFSFLILLVFTLTPLFMQQAYIITSDGVINYFAISVLLMCLNQQRFSWLDTGLFTLLGSIAVSTKPVALPLALIPLIYHTGLEFCASQSSKFTKTSIATFFKKRQLWINVATLVVICVFFMYLYLRIGGTSGLHNHLSGVDPDKQKEFILSNFSMVMTIFTREIISSFNWVYMVGSLGWFDTSVTGDTQKKLLKLSILIIRFEIFLFLLFFLRSVFSRSLRRIIMLGSVFISLFTLLVFSSMLLNCLAMYLVWTPVGSTTLQGIQLRYFFPCFISLASIPLFLSTILAPNDSYQVDEISFSSGREQNLWLLTKFIQLVIVIGFVSIALGLFTMYAGRYW